ncbi:folate/biopterin family MFS transporter [Argonema galeatum]|uniref:folate/biopterin family MFS transporter n=1 Tax=Argonema galeatum TaxID=2942762 RepID=UPI002010C746|nr:folate/biopterin family MFS transporter [Argonema galeatum]MCL1468178.1 folate/biopterin family MFS transporter [Argonema galeatum A003/A1]
MLISPSGKSWFKEFLTKRVFFGVEPSRDLIAILLVYLVMGILGLARLAISFFLKDELGLSPAEVSVLMGIAALPWVVKPLFGFMSDGLPIFGYRRRPYLVLAGLLGSAAWVSLATVVHSTWAATVAIALSSLSSMVSDVIADSLIVERAREETLSKAGSLQSLAWATTALGGFITAYLSGFLLEHFSTHTIFGITATFPLIVSAIAWLIAEEPASQSPHVSNVGNQVDKLRKALSQKAIWMPTVFLFILQATPSADVAFFFFTTNELKFEPEFLGRVRLVTSLASLVGVWLFQRFLKTIPFRTIFGWTIVLSTILGMTVLLLVTHTNRSLGIDDRWFSIGDSLILTVMGQIAYMPILVLSARLCPPGVEATLFALLMSVTNLASLLSSQFGAVLMYWLGITATNFDALWLLVLITNLTTLLPLPFLGLLAEADLQTQIQLKPPDSDRAGQPFLPDLISELSIVNGHHSAAKEKQLITED